MIPAGRRAQQIGRMAMTYTKAKRKKIHQKCNGKCHLCTRRIAFDDYGKTWHIDHSIPRAKGGTDHGNNLFAACINCNCSKADGSNRATRRANGVKRSPLSRKARDKKRIGNMWKGGGLGLLGFRFGPVVGALTTVGGMIAGYKTKPE